MGKSGSKKDDDDMSPEAIVLEAVASTTTDSEKKKAEMRDEDDDEEKLIAAFPPELLRATARNSALQPGAFRGGRNNEDRDDCTAHSSRALQPENHDSPFNDNGDITIEATLVTESSTPTPDYTPVYKGEPMEEASKEVVAINRNWIRWIVVGVCCLSGITGISVGLSVRLTMESEKLEAMEDDAPTAAPSRISLELYDRITHHIALLDFLSTSNTCSDLQDPYTERDGEQRTAGTVIITCGGRDEERERALQQQPDSDDGEGSAGIIVQDMQHCKRLSSDTVSCLVDHERKDILFKCGTLSKNYLDANVTSQTPTATVRVEETMAICNDIDDANTREDSGLTPVVAVFLTLGRLCQSDPLFQFGNITCLEASNQTVSGVNNAKYCVQMQQPCETPDCAVNLDHFLALDMSSDADCQSQYLDSDSLYDDSISSFFTNEITKLREQQETSIKTWLNETIA